MRKAIFIALLFSLVSANTYAQHIIAAFLEKHGKDESIELTNIGKKMFDAMEGQVIDDPKLSGIIAELDNISIVKSTDAAFLQEYYNSASAIVTRTTDYIPIFTREGDEPLMVMIKQDDKVIKELIIISKRPTEFSLVYLGGNISMETLADYSRTGSFDSLKNIIPDE
jgi:hypothetical protein